MAAGDDQTARFYASNAVSYADYRLKPGRSRLQAFLERLQPGADILELGCGNGLDSAFMIERGFRVTPTDGVAEMASEAAVRLGLPVAVLPFEDIEFVSGYDGIWASACLLHVPRQRLAAILARISRALTPGGVFYASYKSGGPEGCDRYDRYYNNPGRDWLEACYNTLPWSSLDIAGQAGGGYDDEPTEWLHVTAVKPD